MIFLRDLQFYMDQALQQGKIAQEKQQVPVGCVLVSENLVLYSGYNGTTPLQHCEILSILWGQKQKIDWSKTHIYITCEPCAMCLSALSLVKIRRIVFGCYNDKFGAIYGHCNLLSHYDTLYKPEIIGGIAELQCAKLLEDFFIPKRNH
jgi:tRNA(adenine34) deaminase